MDNFCLLLIIFAFSLGPDQARQNVGPDLGSNSLTLKKVFLKELLESDKMNRNKLVGSTLISSNYIVPCVK